LALLALVAGLSGCDRGVPLTLEWPSGTLDCRGAIGGVDGSRGQTVVFFDAPSVVDIDAVIEKGDAGGSAGFALGAGKRAVRFVWQGDSNTVVYARSGRTRLLALANGMNLPSDLSRHELHMRVNVDRSGRMTIAGSVDRRPPIDAVSPFSLLNAPLLVTVYTGGSGGHVFSYHVAASNS
jgi:hypothetical protein